VPVTVDAEAGYGMDPAELAAALRSAGAAAVRRANAYLEAGADCVYPIGL